MLGEMLRRGSRGQVRSPSPKPIFCPWAPSLRHHVSVCKVYWARSALPGSGQLVYLLGVQSESRLRPKVGGDVRMAAEIDRTHSASKSCTSYLALTVQHDPSCESSGPSPTALPWGGQPVAMVPSLEFDSGPSKIPRDTAPSQRPRRRFAERLLKA